MAAGRQLGLSWDELRAARRFESEDAYIRAALRFVKAVLERRGHVSESDMNTIREAGYDDGEIAELVANVVLNIFTNYTNGVAMTEIDYPLAEDLP